MPEILKPDLCVIGAGSGGLSVAAAVAAMRVPVVLVERGEMGGDCLNHGCVPSKALIAAAHTAHAMRQAGKFGIGAPEPKTDFAAVQAHVRGVIAAIAPNDSQARFEAMGVRVIRASARFASPTRCEAGGYVIQARRFVIATGSSPAPLPVEGMELVRPLTNESVFDLKELPARLIIIGAGPMGIELAQAFRRLGSEVTVLEAGAALANVDSELSAPVLRQLAAESVVVRENVRIIRVEPRGSGVRLYLEGIRVEETVDGSHLLVAAGRTPNVHNLGLEAAGVQFDPKGIRVDGRLRTSNKRIYAIGDVAGQGQQTHLANYHAGLVVRAALFRQSVEVQPQMVPSAIFSDPEIASTGLSEAQARKIHRQINVLRWPFSENDRAQAERATQGLVKVVTDRKGVILGAGICCAGAGDLIGIWALAISKGMKIRDMAGVVLPYPTRGEIARRVAVTDYAASLRNPWLARALRFFRWFG